MGGGHQNAFELTSDIAAVGFQVAVEVALTKGAGSTLRTVSTRSAKKPVPSGSAVRAKASVNDKRISTKNKERGITVESSSGANPHAQARHPARTRPTTPPAPERRPVVVKQQTRQNVEQDRIQRVAAQFGCACFAPGTLVATPHGLTPIEHLQVGDLVLSMDELTGEVAFKPIAETFVTPDKEMIQVAVTTPDGDTEVITTTPGHPFWVIGIGWTYAGDLRAGDQVVSANSISDAGALALLASGQATLYEVAAVSEVVRRGTVFNFEVQDFHTYFVGHSGAWVHNTSKCEGSDGPIVPDRIIPVTERTGTRVDRARKGSARKGDFVFRADSRAPAEIFETGFHPTGTSTNLLDRVEGKRTIFVGASKSPTAARSIDLSSKGDFIFTIRRGKSGIDVNDALEELSPFPHELEVAFPLGIPSEAILGARRLGKGNKFVGPFVRNPNFDPDLLPFKRK